MKFNDLKEFESLVDRLKEVTGIGEDKELSKFLKGDEYETYIYKCRNAKSIDLDGIYSALRPIGKDWYYVIEGVHAGESRPRDPRKIEVDEAEYSAMVVKAHVFDEEHGFKKKQQLFSKAAAQSIPNPTIIGLFDVLFGDLVVI